AWKSAPSKALGTVANEVSSEFNRQVPSMVPDPDVSPDDYELLNGDPGAIFVAVGISGSTGQVVWIGSGSAVLVRGFEIAERTVPHTLLEQARASGVLSPEKAPEVPDVATRSIGPGRDDQSEESSFDL